MNNQVLVLDTLKCTGCHSCEVACSVAREGVNSFTRSRIKVVEFETEDFNFPVVCQQCEIPYCALVCPTTALKKNPQTGVVDWMEARCIGCKMCLLACPFGALGFSEGRVLKCDLCAGKPTCVAFCQPKALTYDTAAEVGDGRRFALAESVKKTQAKKEE